MSSLSRAEQVTRGGLLASAVEAMANQIHAKAEASAANAGLRVYRTRGLFGLRINRQYVHPMMEDRK